MWSQPSTYTSTVVGQREKEENEEFLQWFFNPVNHEVFLEEKWEKQPFLFQRSRINYYKKLYNFKKFEKTVNQDLHYNPKIDVVAYVDGERKTLTKDSRVLPSFLWSAFKEGYSIRMRNSQVYSKSLESICSGLQEYFSSYVDANIYLTPADTQGFPPHYDDTDAFILQLGGKKLWKLYTPSEREMLATHSSPDLSEAEIGVPCMEVELYPGDMLYFPRGYIHQAKAAPDTHSLHLTVSISQLNTWGNFLKSALSNALQEATENNIELRKSIPKDYMNYMGQIHSDTNSKERQDFREKAKSLVIETFEHLSADYAADVHGINFIHGSLPPCLTPLTKNHSVHGNGVSFEDDRVLVSIKLSLNTKIRLIQKKAFRLVVDLHGARLYHPLFNTNIRKERAANYIKVDPENVPALTDLLKAHPDYKKIKDLPHRNSAQLLKFLQPLYDNGFLMTEELLPFED